MSQFDIKSMEVVGDAMTNTIKTIQNMQHCCEDLLTSLNELKGSWQDQDIEIVIGMTQDAKKEVENAVPYLSAATNSVLEYLDTLSAAKL